MVHPQVISNPPPLNKLFAGALLIKKKQIKRDLHHNFLSQNLMFSIQFVRKLIDKNTIVVN